MFANPNDPVPNVTKVPIEISATVEVAHLGALDLDDPEVEESIRAQCRELVMRAGAQTALVDDMKFEDLL